MYHITSCELCRDVLNELPTEDERENISVPLAASAAKQAILRTSVGDIVIKLFSAECPKTIENFTVSYDYRTVFMYVLCYTYSLSTAVCFLPASSLFLPQTHAKNGYYDGVIFHRVIKGFMIQVRT